jgi:uncharacterized protein
MPEEILLSPGVIAIENDQSFISQQPVQAGTAIIGPAVKGPVGIPTIVTSYSDYVNKFGSVFVSGSQTFSFFTSISAYNFFQNGGSSLLVTRVVSGSFTPATSSLIPTSTAATSASVSLDLTYISSSVESVGSSSFDVNGITFFFTGSNVANTPTVIYVNTSSFAASNVTDYVTTSSIIFTFSSSVAPYSASLLNISSSVASPNITFTYIGQNGLSGNSQYIISGSTTTFFTGGTNTEAFILETISEGIIMNSDSTPNTDGTLPSGSIDNLRWQVVSPSISDGTFNLLIRRGDDLTNSPSVLETWGPLSLDPFSSNYIEKVIGNQTQTIASDGSDFYLQLTGSFTNNSSYVRVKQVNITTPNYLDNSGNPITSYTASIPIASNGTFGSATGNILPSTQGRYYENISDATNSQGLQASDYTQSINLLSNKDAYRYNLITTPGLIYSFASHTSTLTLLNSIAQSNGNSLMIFDSVGYGAETSTVANTPTLNSSYAATYWPWVRTIDPGTGQQVWVPASTMMPGVYAFSDSISEPWFAPAGINRGVMANVTMAEKYLTQGNRDTLYNVNVNPIATFPNNGVVVFGQKTSQKKKSALDRVGVRRLLIEVKSYISQIADTLVFEQNTTATRNSFLLQVNPYLTSIQQRDGLTSFRVVMDESNNTPTTIDNNQLIGAIYLQPTRTAEFIYLTFNVTPTGVSFE